MGQPPQTATRPQVFVIGGPNGAGKTTIAGVLIREYLDIGEFVNADVIARGLAGFDPDSAALQAGRIMLERLRELAAARADFAFETTLASRTFAPWLRRLAQSGYEVHIVYSWLRSPSLAVSRVRRRVREGGHAVPPETIVRRYGRSAWNLLNLYIPLATTWRVYDNSGQAPRPVARGGRHEATEVFEPATWRRIREVSDVTREPNDS